jgi:hypothetical protein
MAILRFYRIVVTMLLAAVISRQSRKSRPRRPLVTAFDPARRDRPGES